MHDGDQKSTFIKELTMQLNMERNGNMLVIRGDIEYRNLQAGIRYIENRIKGNGTN